MDPTVITTGHLILRPWEPADAPAVHAACQDDDVQHWTTVPSPYTLTDARLWVSQVSPTGWAEGAAASFAVLAATEGRLLGAVGLAFRPGGPEVGYWTAGEARGRGVAAESVAAACRWAFGALGVERVTWQAYLGNWGSRAVAERCGFTIEGVARRAMLQRGVWRDGWTGSLLATDQVRDRRALPSRVELTDGVVTLRRWRSADAADVALACDDPLTARWLPLPSPYTLADGAAFVDQLTAANWAGGRAAELAVTDAGTGELLGAAGLSLPQHASGVAAVGYWTAPWTRGRGVAGRAAVLLAEWGLAELGLARIELLADVDNPASHRVADKGGFIREGIARRRIRDRVGRPRDMVVFSRIS